MLLASRRSSTGSGKRWPSRGRTTRTSTLKAISRGFPTGYSDEALDAFEQEAAPFAATLAEGIKDDDEFPCKPTQ